MLLLCFSLGNKQYKWATNRQQIYAKKSSWATKKRRIITHKVNKNKHLANKGKVITSQYKSFSKQFLKCPQYIQEATKEVITLLEKAKSLDEIKGIQKLTGFKFFYRIRIGQFRIGIKSEKPNVILIYVMERSQIYKVSPPF